MNFNRRNHRLFCAATMWAVAAIGLNSSVLAQDIWFVDASVAECDNDGDSWANAFKYLQDALAAANGANNDVIWVAAGTYQVDQDCDNPDGIADREATYDLIDKVWLLGGFVGDETVAEDRDPELNVTILSGIVNRPASGCGGGGGSDTLCCEIVCDLEPLCCSFDWDSTCDDIAIDVCGEAYHVVTAESDITSDTVIDGFTIRDGVANGLNVAPDVDQDHGGGMLVQGEPVISRCLFIENAASLRGCGLSVEGERIQPQIINCTFRDNPGSVIYNITDGGGMANKLGNPLVLNCLFYDNIVPSDGGGIYNEGGECAAGGPGLCGVVEMYNCTFADNVAGDGPGSGRGGGIVNLSGSKIDASNCIFYYNTDEDGPLEDSQIYGHDTSTVTYSIIQGCDELCPGTGNTSTAPTFIDRPGRDYRLGLDSAGIDEGNNDDVQCDLLDFNNDGENCTSDPVGDNPDLDLFDRVIDGDEDSTADVDKGAYEFQTCPWDLDGDCEVGIGDLLILLLNWNNPYGVGDLLAMLAAWGPCYCDPDADPPTLAEELADACLSPANWDDFVAMMGDPNASQEDKDRFYCWMVHYLDHCDKCTCTHIPTCPSPDPYT